MIDCIPEITISGFAPYSDGAYVAYLDDTGQIFDALYDALKPEDGGSYQCTVIFDGARYVTTLGYGEGELTVFVCGNAKIAFPDSDDRGFPFLFLAAGAGAMLFTDQPGESHTFALLSVMRITSEQYKTCLFEQCRRALRINTEDLRVAYYDMVYQVLEHDGVVVDADSYTGFQTALEGYLNYLSDNNRLTADLVFLDPDFEAKGTEFWGTAFAAIGVTFAITGTSALPSWVSFKFTFPDGKEQNYTLQSGDPGELNVRFYSSLDYARKIMPYWDIQPSEDTVPLNELAGNRASFVTNWEEGGLYWHYNADTKEIEFTGTGDLKMLPSQFTGSTNGLSLGTVLTAIYGAGVTGLPSGAFDWGTVGGTCTIVCLHGASDAVTLGGDLASIGYSDSHYTLEIYCDNEAIRAGTFGLYVQVNWHPLSEWAG